MIGTYCNAVAARSGLDPSAVEARVVINQWLEEYNTVRPHGSLGGMNPEKFLQCWSEKNLNQQPETLTG